MVILFDRFNMPADVYEIIKEIAGDDDLFINRTAEKGNTHINIDPLALGQIRGQNVARQVQSIRDAGAYSALNTYVVEKHAFNVCGPYFIPNILVEGYCVYTNRPPASSPAG